MRLDNNAQSFGLFLFNKHALLAFAACTLWGGYTKIAHAVPASYLMTEIGITPTAINNNGQLVGSNFFMYNSANNTLNNIQVLTEGGALSAVYDINRFGQVSGISSNQAIVRDNSGNGLNLGVLPGDAASAAYAINDSGQVVGISAPSSPTPCEVHAFLGNIAVPGIPLLDLGALGGTRNYANDINNLGQIVGKSSINPATDCLVTGIYHAYVGNQNGLRDLHGSGMLGNNSAAYKSNIRGQIVGDFASGLTTVGTSVYYPAGYPINHAVVWNTNTNTYRDLGNGTEDSSLRAINATGLAVGYERTFNTANFASTTPLVLTQNAVVADTASGGLVDLNTLVPALPAGWSIKSASDINDAGQIIAIAKDASSINHGILLTPLDLPPTPTPQLPLTPSNLVPKVASSNQINLSWQDNASNETAQYIERCLDASCANFTQIAILGTNVTSYSDTLLTPATNYWYRIKAHNNTGDSGYSNIAAATTLPLVTATVPAAPTGLYSPDIARNMVVSWNDNANNETSFAIERCRGAICTRFSNIKTVGANVTSYSNSALLSNTTYRYRVRAANAIGQSAYSNTLTVKTLPYRAAN